jgi:hypothetical protein
MQSEGQARSGQGRRTGAHACTGGPAGTGASLGLRLSRLCHCTCSTLPGTYHSGTWHVCCGAYHAAPAWRCLGPLGLYAIQYLFGGHLISSGKKCSSRLWQHRALLPVCSGSLIDCEAAGQRASAVGLEFSPQTRIRRQEAAGAIMLLEDMPL